MIWNERCINVFFLHLTGIRIQSEVFAEQWIWRFLGGCNKTAFTNLYCSLLLLNLLLPLARWFFFFFLLLLLLDDSSLYELRWQSPNVLKIVFGLDSSLYELRCVKIVCLTWMCSNSYIPVVINLHDMLHFNEIFRQMSDITKNRP